MYNIKCFIVCGEDEHLGISEIIGGFDESNHMTKSVDGQNYRTGWRIQKSYSWSDHIFYGGLVCPKGLDLFFDDLNVMISKFSEANGFVYIESEENGFQKWEFDEGKIFKK